MALIGCSLQELPRSQPSGFNISLRPRDPATTLTTLATFTIHPLGRWLVLQLLLQVARLYAASLPLALSLRKPGFLGDAVGRLLFRCALDLSHALFLARWPSPTSCVGLAFLTSPLPRTAFDLSATPRLSLWLHPIVNCHLSHPRCPPPSPEPSSTCNRSRAYRSGKQRSMTPKIVDGRRRSGLKEHRDRFGMISPSKFLLSHASTLRNLGFGPKHAPRLKKAARQAVGDRPMATIVTTAPSPTPAFQTRTTRPTPTFHDTLQSISPTACLRTRHRGC